MSSTTLSKGDQSLSVIDSDNRISDHSIYDALNSLPHIVWVTRPDGYHEYYNDNWYEYTGVERGETDGHRWNNLFHPDDQARARAIWKHSLDTGDPYRIEYRLYNAETESYRWVLGRAMPHYDNDGQIDRWYGTCTDIHEQKHSFEIQSFLLEVSKKLSSTLEMEKILSTISELCVPQVADWCSIDMFDETSKVFEQIHVAHRDRKKVSLAKEFRKRRPIDKDQPTGVANVVRTNKIESYLSITDEMIDASIKDKTDREFMKSLSMHSIIIAPLCINKKPVGAITLVASESNRTYSSADVDMVEILSARISLAITNATLYDKSQNDLKERKRLERELIREKQKLEARVNERTQQLQLTNQGLREEIHRRTEAESELSEYSKELARSNKELEDFAYVASHDLQEPLRKIQAFGNLLANDYSDRLDDDGIDYIRRMQKSADRMSTLIQDLLAFSRVSTHSEPPQCVELQEILSNMLFDLEQRISDTGATVKVGKLPTVMADPTHMHQLFLNLVGNAIKFHKPDVAPNVSITSQLQGSTAIITVKDNGIGFDQKYEDRIFNVFQRLNGRANYEGTGIGLAVCRKIVEKYNGHITVKSEVGKGTTFTIRLPH